MPGAALDSVGFGNHENVCADTSCAAARVIRQLYLKNKAKNCSRDPLETGKGKSSDK